MHDKWSRCAGRARDCVCGDVGSGIVVDVVVGGGGWIRDVCVLKCWAKRWASGDGSGGSVDVSGCCIRDWLVGQIDGGRWLGSIGDGGSDGDCMGGVGVILAG